MTLKPPPGRARSNGSGWGHAGARGFGLRRFRPARCGRRESAGPPRESLPRPTGERSCGSSRRAPHSVGLSRWSSAGRVITEPGRRETGYCYPGILSRGDSGMSLLANEAPVGVTPFGQLASSETAWIGNTAISVYTSGVALELSIRIRREPPGLPYRAIDVLMDQGRWKAPEEH